jgi:hypothetical protein
MTKSKKATKHKVTKANVVKTRGAKDIKIKKEHRDSKSEQLRRRYDNISFQGS